MTGAGHRALPYVVVALAACVWGTWALVLRRAEAIGPIPAALESAVAMAVLTAVSGLASLRDRVARRATWRARAWIAFMGVSDAFNVLLLFAAYKLAIGVSVLAHYLAPVFVAIAAPFALRERMTPRTAAAVAASFAGLAVILAPLPGGGGALEATRGSVAMSSAALGAGSAVFYASNVIVTKFVVDDFSTSETSFWHGLVATPLLAAFVPRAAWGAVDAHALTFLAIASVGPGALAGIAFVWALRRIPAAHASTLTLLEPLVAVIVGAAAYGEALGAKVAVGGAMILGGALAVASQGARGEQPA